MSNGNTTKKEDIDAILNQASNIEAFLKLYIAPVAAIIIFGAVTLFLLIPKIRNVLSDIEEINALNTELNDKNDEITALNELSTNQNALESDLDVIDSIAPAVDPQVVAFRDKITSIAIQNNIDITSQDLEDQNLEEDSTDTEEDTIKLREIPSRFNVNGNYNDILSFIDDLDTTDEFIVIKEFDLTKVSRDSNDLRWNMDLTLVKYQFNDVDDATALERFSQVPASATISDELRDYIENKR